MINKFIGSAVIITALIVAIGLLLALPVKWLVNSVFSAAFIQFIFGVVQISVWRAWGLLILCGMLFKGNTATDNKK